MHRPQPEGPDIKVDDPKQPNPEPEPERGTRPAEDDAVSTQPTPQVEEN